MPKTLSKRRPARLSVDPAEHRSHIAILAAAKQRSAAFIITELASQRINQLLAEYAIPKDKVALIPSDSEQEPQILDGSASSQTLRTFLQAPSMSKTLADGRRVLYTAQRRPVNIRASLILNVRLCGPVVVGPSDLIREK